MHWKKGNGSILLGVLICALGIFLIARVTETINIFQGSIVAQTRADLIADGSAAFGASYDNTLDEGKVALMSSLLLASNTDFNNPLSMQIDYSLLSNRQVRVRVTSIRDFWFSHSDHILSFQVSKEAISELIDP
mgnify:FL=1